MNAVQKFILSARKLHVEEKDAVKRWEKMTPLLQELIADPTVRSNRGVGLLADKAIEHKTYSSTKILTTSL